jgi:hypothetical protein
VARLLGELASDLREGTWRPLPARKVLIPKPGSSEFSYVADLHRRLPAADRQRRTRVQPGERLPHGRESHSHAGTRCEDRGRRDCRARTSPGLKRDKTHPPDHILRPQ